MTEKYDKPTLYEVKALASSVDGLFQISQEDLESKAGGMLLLAYGWGKPPDSSAERRRLLIRDLVRCGYDWKNKAEQQRYEERERKRFGEQKLYISPERKRKKIPWVNDIPTFKPKSEKKR